MVMERVIKGIKTVVVVDRMAGRGSRYNFVAYAHLLPEPISYSGRVRTLSDAICKGFNSVSVGIRQMEEM